MCVCVCVSRLLTLTRLTSVSAFCRPRRQHPAPGSVWIAPPYTRHSKRSQAGPFSTSRQFAQHTCTSPVSHGVARGPLQIKASPSLSVVLGPPARHPSTTAPNRVRKIRCVILRQHRLSENVRLRLTSCSGTVYVPVCWSELVALGWIVVGCCAVRAMTKGKSRRRGVVDFLPALLVHPCRWASGLRLDSGRVEPMHLNSLCLFVFI